MPFVFNPFTGNLDYDSVGADVTLAGTPDYITIAGQVITRALINLTTHVTGILPSANGGTGVNNAGTITNATNTTITGGGTLALAGYTLTVPGTGTAALLNQANSFTLINPLTTIAESWIGPSSTTGIYFKGGFVGYGTTAPEMKLDVNGQINIANGNALYVGYPGADYSYFGNTGTLIKGSGSTVLFYGYNNQASIGTTVATAGNILTISGNTVTSGNVGIGTALPTNLLSLGGNAARIL